MENIVEAILVVLALLVLAVLVSLPGIVVAWLGWKLSRNIRPVLFQALLRAGLIAVAVTPSFYGHAGVMPAIVLAVVLQGGEKSAGIVPILIVWVRGDSGAVCPR